jgi:RHS repeat-associated protein
VATYRVDISGLVANAPIDSRGYTGHEHLDGVELIHMNGRVFDPVSALFISADPNIPDASNQYYMNRYSYGFNNPVTFTDPSGYFSVRSFFRAVGVMGINALIPGAVDEHERFRKSEHGQLAYSIAITVISGGAGVGWAMAGGFASGYMATGTMEGAALGALFAGASFGVGEIAGQISNAYAAAATRAVMHGALGGIRARMNGGSFSAGFRSAGLVSIVGDIGGYASLGVTSPAGKIAASAVLGGTVSEISGGKFANGAISAAFVQAYNHGNHTEEQQGGAESLHTMLDENGIAYDTVIWNQGTGEYVIINSDGSVLNGKGYSGVVGATNNPNFEGVKDKGPIPKGVYAGIRQGKDGAIKLIPYKSIDMSGRNLFKIHGDYRLDSPKFVLYGASKGCPIINLTHRNKISSYSKLIVYGDDEWQTSI